MVILLHCRHLQRPPPPSPSVLDQATRSTSSLHLHPLPRPSQTIRPPRISLFCITSCLVLLCPLPFPWILQSPMTVWILTPLASKTCKHPPGPFSLSLIIFFLHFFHLKCCFISFRFPILEFVFFIIMVLTW
jgi:hypothetical protein